MNGIPRACAAAIMTMALVPAAWSAAQGAEPEEISAAGAPIGAFVQTLTPTPTIDGLDDSRPGRGDEPEAIGVVPERELRNYIPGSIIHPDEDEVPPDDSEWRISGEDVPGTSKLVGPPPQRPRGDLVVPRMPAPDSGAADASAVPAPGATVVLGLAAAAALRRRRR